MPYTTDFYTPCEGSNFELDYSTRHDDLLEAIEEAERMVNNYRISYAKITDTLGQTIQTIYKKTKYSNR